MTCYRSIGLTELVALMASHRSVEAGQSPRPGELDQEEFQRITAYLHNGTRLPAPSGFRPGGQGGPRFRTAAERYSRV